MPLRAVVPREQGCGLWHGVFGPSAPTLFGETVSDGTPWVGAVAASAASHASCRSQPVLSSKHWSENRVNHILDNEY